MNKTQAPWLITIGGEQSLVWDVTQPLMLGLGTHPWIVEKTSNRTAQLRPLKHSGRMVPLALTETQGARLPSGDIVTLKIPRGISLADLSVSSGNPADLVLQPSEPRDQKETDTFKRALVGSLLGFGALTLVSSLYKKPDQSAELIPEQVAKLVLTAPKKIVQPAEQAARAGGAPAGSKAERKAAVTQAFKSDQVQKSISKLLKGGMSHLVKQSNFVSGVANSPAARDMLKNAAVGALALAPDAGAALGKGKPGLMGGAAGPGGSGVGYAKGGGASVAGQGNGHLALDLDNANVAEGLTKDQVGEVIHRHMKEIRLCYENAMVRSPDIEGKLIAAFTIGASGRVIKSGAQQSTLPDPSLDQCILSRLSSWQFPQPRGGVDVAVTYPFLFKTLGR